MHLPLLLANTTFLLTSSAVSLGINCRGSPACHFVFTRSAPTTQNLAEALWASGLAPQTSYSDGQHIACLPFDDALDNGDGNGSGGGGICAFPQNTASSSSSLGDDRMMTMEQILPLMGALIEHGCLKCGSVPVHFRDWGSNDPRWGVLKLDYVAHPVCDGATCVRAKPGSAAQPSVTVLSSLVSRVFAFGGEGV